MMFFRGFLIGLVAGVWLTVLYIVITTRGDAIRSYLTGARRHATPTSTARQAEKRSVFIIKLRRKMRSAKSAIAKRRSVPLHKRLDPARLSVHGAARYRELSRLVHDEQTARRLIQHEARLQPNVNTEKLIDNAIDRLLHDRR